MWPQSFGRPVRLEGPAVKQLHPPVAPDRGVLITIGVPNGEQGDTQTQRAVEVLARAGFRCGLTSDNTILAGSKRDHRKAGGVMLETVLVVLVVLVIVILCLRHL
jgi:hypothetical protein